LISALDGADWSTSRPGDHLKSKSYRLNVAPSLHYFKFCTCDRSAVTGIAKYRPDDRSCFLS